MLRSMVCSPTSAAVSACAAASATIDLHGLEIGDAQAARPPLAGNCDELGDRPLGQADD